MKKILLLTLICSCALWFSFAGSIEVRNVITKLSELTDDVGFFRKDGSVPMTGDLDMGDNVITNTGNIYVGGAGNGIFIGTNQYSGFIGQRTASGPPGTYNMVIKDQQDVSVLVWDNDARHIYGTNDLPMISIGNGNPPSLISYLGQRWEVSENATNGEEIVNYQTGTNLWAETGSYNYFSAPNDFLMFNEFNSSNRFNGNFYDNDNNLFWDNANSALYGPFAGGSPSILGIDLYNFQLHGAGGYTLDWYNRTLDGNWVVTSNATQTTQIMNWQVTTGLIATASNNIIAYVDSPTNTTTLEMTNNVSFPAGITVAGTLIDGTISTIGVANVSYNANFIPTSSNAFDLGSVAKPVRTGYFHTVVASSNSFYLGDLKLSASGGTLQVADGTNDPVASLIADDIGSTVQAWDADLDTYAGITPSANIQTLLGSASYAEARTNLSLVVGTDVQAYSEHADGSLYLTNGTTTALTAAGGYEKITQFQQRLAQNVTMTSSNLTVTPAGVYDINFSASFSSSANNTLPTMRIFTNGAQVVGAGWQRTISSTAVGTVAGGAHLQLPAGCVIDCRIDTESLDSTITWKSGEFSVIKMRD